jgi:hypothetical protein
MWICWTTSCTTCRKVVDLLWIGCGFVVQHLRLVVLLFDLLWTSRKLYPIGSICCGFVVSTAQIRNILICPDVVDLLYNLLYSKSTTNRTSGVWAYKQRFWYDVKQHCYRHSVIRHCLRRSFSESVRVGICRPELRRTDVREICVYVESNDFFLFGRQYRQQEWSIKCLHALRAVRCTSAFSWPCHRVWLFQTVLHIGADDRFFKIQSNKYCVSVWADTTSMTLNHKMIGIKRTNQILRYSMFYMTNKCTFDLNWIFCS